MIVSAGGTAINAVVSSGGSLVASSGGLADPAPDVRISRFRFFMEEPRKTRFVDFRDNRPNGTDHPETDGTSFTFLGFSHIWGKSLRGKNVVRQVTAKNRYARAPKEASPPFLAEIYRKVAVRYVFMAEELLKGPARNEDAFEGADLMISRLRPDPS
jgi:hypothetical protein